MAKRFFFFSNEDALVFAAKVNSRRRAIHHYEVALAGECLTAKDEEFLNRQIKALRSQVAELMATA